MEMKRKDPSKTLHRWELALLLGVALSALLGARLGAEQTALAEKVIRLHVVAASDSAQDQALKLEVRDAILAQAGALFGAGKTRAEAEGILRDHLEDFAAISAETAGKAGFSGPVTASLEEAVWFPTKEYEDFALPAGNYRALRIVIGEGEGHNWWCVVFPPLCLGSVTETAAGTAAEGGLSEEEVALITGASEGYVVKFRAMEFWQQLQRWLEGEG